MAGNPRDPMLPARFRVLNRKAETRDTFTLELAPECGQKHFHFAPGQFNMLYIFGAGEIPISISGDPGRPETIVHTTRAVGTVTKVMRQLRRGDTLGVRGPFGSHWPVSEAGGQDVLIVAGGIGLAPLRPALYRFLAQREKYGKIILLYGTRTPEDILYTRELKKWGAQFDMEVQVTVDRSNGTWRGNVGVVPRLIPRAPFDPDCTTALVCGPEVMMRYSVLELLARGVKPESVYISMERNMKCAVGFCGHCQFGPTFICKDGPVFRYDHVRRLFEIREV